MNIQPEWLNGRRWTLTRGKDYREHSALMAVKLRGIIKARGLKLTVKTLATGKVIVEPEG